MNFDGIKSRDKIFLYAGDLYQWNFTSVKDRFRITEKKWTGLTLPKYGNNGTGTEDENHILLIITPFS